MSVSVSSYLDKYTYEYLRNEALSRVDDRYDKREGSIISDAISPACYLLAEYFSQIRNLVDNSFIDTAWGIYLDKICAALGLGRLSATKTLVVMKLYTQDSDGKELPFTDAEKVIGTQYEALEDAETITYTITSAGENAGEYLAETTATGLQTGAYTHGEVKVLNYVKDLTRAEIKSVAIFGQDEESDDSLRQRYYERVKTNSFGGNVAQYKEILYQQPYVTACQIFPAWNGGGTVKVAFLTSSPEEKYIIPSRETIQQLKNYLDPLDEEGKGTGAVPIGHKVTVVAPDVVYIGASITLIINKALTTISEVRATTLNIIKAMLENARVEWKNTLYTKEGDEQIRISVSQLMAQVQQIEGVTTITSTKVASYGVDKRTTPEDWEWGTTDILIPLSAETTKVPFFDNYNAEIALTVAEVE